MLRGKSIKHSRGVDLVRALEAVGILSGWKIPYLLLMNLLDQASTGQIVSFSMIGLALGFYKMERLWEIYIYWDIGGLVPLSRKIEREEKLWTNKN